MDISFRPHHFLCAYCYQGRGYSPDFIANFSALMEKLSTEGDATLIEIVAHTDSICAPCPHKRALLCTSQEKIIALDAAHAEILNLLPGEKITWGEAKKRIRENMTLEKFHAACQRCEWKKLGICEDVLKNN